MDAFEFMREIESFMGSLGLDDLEGSGLRFPAVGWDWLDCCHACAWLTAEGHDLPGNLVSRMMLGPWNPSVRLYCQLLEFRRGE